MKKYDKVVFQFMSLLLLLFILHCESTRVKISEKEFLNPSIVNRPLVLWPWLNGYVDTVKLIDELEEMKEKGLRGAIIWDIGSLADPEKMIPEGPAFLGSESLKYISLALKTAGDLGLDIGMVASSSWNAGGDWVLPEDASKQLLCSSQIVEGPAKKQIKIGVPETRRGPVKRYSLISSLAMPYTGSKIIDVQNNDVIFLDEFTSKENIIDWEIPEGKWEVFSFFMCNTGQHLVCPSPNSDGLVIDHLSNIATGRHFENILSRLDNMGTRTNHIKFLMLDSYEVWRMKDWSPELLKAFRKRYEYDPLPFLPLLLGYEDDDSVFAERFRGDYSRLVSDMMIENHFGQSVDIAGENDIQMLSEAGHGGSPRVDPLKALGHSHIPMGEFWNRKRFWVTKEAASAAHIYNRRLVAAESLTGWNHWQHGPADFKQLIDIAFCAGLNQVVFHTFAHNPRIAGKPGFTYHAGEHINVNTTWWEMAKPFMDYISRCSYLLRQGLFVADACLYYGDQAPNLVPSRRIDPNIKPIYGEGQCLHCGQPKPVDPGDMAGYDFDYMNEEIITNDLKVEDGNLVLPFGQTYRVMLLPDRDDISPEVLRSLEKLVYDGAVIIGPKPQRTTSLKNYPLCDEEVTEIARKMWGNCDGKTVFSHEYGKGTVYWGKTVKQVLEELGVEPDFSVSGTDNSDKHIDYIHRQTASEDIYFISNSSREIENITCRFRIDENKIPEIWDPKTGLIQRRVNYSKESNGLSLKLTMAPLESKFIVFRKYSSGINDTDLNDDLQTGIQHLRKSPAVPQSIDLSNNWDIHFKPEMGGPKNYHLAKLLSWSEIGNDSIKYYSGTATYSRTFTVNKNVLSKEMNAFIEFEDIRKIAHVFVNGHDCGIIWTPPYVAQITPYLRAGENQITVQVVNTWNNRIVGDLREPDKKPYTTTNIKYKFHKNDPLLKSGLIGKATIVFGRKFVTTRVAYETN